MCIYNDALKSANQNPLNICIIESANKECNLCMTFKSFNEQLHVQEFKNWKFFAMNKSYMVQSYSTEGCLV